MCKFTQENYNQAIELLKKASEIAPKNPKIHSNLGNVHRSKGKLKDAIKEFKLAVDYSSGVQQGIAYLDLASANFENGNIGQSLNFFKEAAASGPQVLTVIKSKGYDLMLSKAEILKGIKHILSHEYKGAIKTLKKVYSNNKTNLAAGYLIGLAFMQINDSDKAKKYFKDVVKYGESGINAKKQFAKLLVAKSSKAIAGIKETIYDETNSIEEFESATDFPDVSSKQLPYALDLSKSGIHSKHNSRPQTPRSRSNSPAAFKVPLVSYVPIPVPQPSSIEISDSTSRSPRYANRSSLKKFAASADPKPENCSIF